MNTKNMYNEISPEELLQRLIDAVSDLNFCCSMIENMRIRAIGYTDSVQMAHLDRWCKALNIEYFREDWEGNEECKSNHDIIWFMVDGVKFFELVDKENEDDNK